MTISVQLPLFKDLPPVPRPKMYSEQVLELTLDKLMPKVMDWFKKFPGHDFDLGECDEVRQNVRDAIEFTDDSYEIVKELDDRHYWETDGSLVHVMDEVSHLRHAAHKELVERWVIENAIEPKFNIDDTVVFLYRGKRIKGKIKKINQKHADYTVFAEEMKSTSPGVTIHGIVLPYEEIKSIQEGEAK